MIATESRLMPIYSGEAHKNINLEMFKMLTFFIFQIFLEHSVEMWKGV